jgi:hypothetical protein
MATRYVVLGFQTDLDIADEGPHAGPFIRATKEEAERLVLTLKREDCEAHYMTRTSPDGVYPAKFELNTELRDEWFGGAPIPQTDAEFEPWWNETVAQCVVYRIFEEEISTRAYEPPNDVASLIREFDVVLKEGADVAGVIIAVGKLGARVDPHVGMNFAGYPVLHIEFKPWENEAAMDAACEAIDKVDGVDEIHFA